MKKKTTKKPSRKKKLPSILGTEAAYQYLQENPATENQINHICEQLIEYACSQDGLYIGSFLRKMRIPKQTFHNWQKKWPQLREAVREAEYYLGYGRMEGAITKRLDKGAVLHSQHRFGEEWKQDDAYHDQRKQAEEDKTANIKVIVQKPEEVIDRTKYKPLKGRECEHSEKSAAAAEKQK